MESPGGFHWFREDIRRVEASFAIVGVEIDTQGFKCLRVKIHRCPKVTEFKSFEDLPSRWISLLEGKELLLIAPSSVTNNFNCHKTLSSISGPFIDANGIMGPFNSDA